MDDQLSRPGTDRRAKGTVALSEAGTPLPASSVVYLAQVRGTTSSLWTEVTTQENLAAVQANSEQFELRTLFTVPVDDVSRAPIGVVHAAVRALDQVERRRAKAERRASDRHPTEELEWEGDLGLLAMKAGANELQSVVELAEKSALKFTQVRTADAAQAIKYIKYLIELAGKAQTGAQQAGAEVDTETLAGQVWKAPATQSQAVPSELASDWPTHADLLAEDLEKIAETWTGCMYEGKWGRVDIGADLRAAFAKLKLADRSLSHSAATGKDRPTDDHLWDETIRDRDTYHEWADKLAEAISKHFGAYIGEHSNTNCPWAEALEAIENAEPGAATGNVPEDADPILTHQDIFEVWQGMPGGPEGWLKYFGYIQFAEAIEDKVLSRLAASPAAPLAGKAPSTGSEQIDSFLADYEIRADEGVYSLTAHDRWVIANFLIELDEEVPFLSAPLAAAVPAEEASYDALYAAWHKVGADVAGLRWEDFAAALKLSPAEPAPIQASALTDKEMRAIEVECDSMYSMGRAVEREILARLSKPTAQGTAEPASLDASIEKLEKVARWINKFPVPTDGATTNYCRVHDVIVELRRHIAAQAPADRDAVLEEAAVLCETQEGLSDEDMKIVKCCAFAIRYIKSQPAASHGAVEGEQNEGGEHA